MAPLPRVLPETGRRGFRSRHNNWKTNWRYGVALTLCALLLGVGFFLSPTRRTMLSGEVQLVLSDLEERLRMSDSADAVTAMQRDMQRVAAGSSPRSDRVSHLFAELLHNIRGLGWALPCVDREPAAGGGLAAVNSSACSGGCYFAVTLEDGTSFDTLPSLVTQLLAVLGRLGNGEHARRSFVSVYATASQDPSTPELLNLLRRMLDLLGVPNRVVTRGSIRRPPPGSKRTAAAAQDQHRLLLRTANANLAGAAGMDLMGGGGSGTGGRWAGTELGSEDGYRAALRNAVLEPLVAIGDPRRCDGTGSEGHGGGGTEDAERLPCPQLSPTSPPPPARVSTLVFVAGGAFLCAADVLRLLRHSSADVACGLDLAKAPLPLLTPDERRAAMAAHTAAAWGLPRSWADALSRSGLAYGTWARMYGRTGSYLPWSHLVLREVSSVQWSRDAAGQRLRPLPPYAADAWTASRLGLGLPTPVHGCWGGLVVARAHPFLGRRAPAAGAAESAAASAGAARRAVRAAGVDGGGGAEAESGSGLVAGDTRTGANAGVAGRAAGARRLRDVPPLRFRALPSGSGVAGVASRQADAPGQGQGEGGCVDSAPELLLCGDMHERRRHRWLVDPNVRLTYEWPAALELYGNFEMAAPENVRALTFQAEELGVGDFHVSEEREEDEFGGDYGSSISSSTSSDSDSSGSSDGAGTNARLGGLTAGEGTRTADSGGAGGPAAASALAAEERRARVRAERRWQQEWLPRVAAGAAAVECCAPEADTGAAGGSSSLCVRQDRSAAWRDWSAASGGSGGGGGGAAAAAIASGSRKWRGSDLLQRSAGSESQSATEASGGGAAGAGAVSAADAAADAALTALES